MLSKASQLATLATVLCEVRSLTVGESGGMEVVECVGALLDELARCGDAVLGAARLLTCSESGDRLVHLALALRWPFGQIWLMSEAWCMGDDGRVLRALASTQQRSERAAYGCVSI